MTVAAPSLDQTAQLFHALSDATRLGILERLGGGERCVCELMDSLDAAQSRLSFHLKVLKDAGLVTDRRDGRWVYYTLSVDALDDVAAFAGELKSAARTAARAAAKCC